MIRWTTILLISFSMAGCASVKYPLPSCDGYSKRPLNRSMWDWDKSGNSAEQPNAVNPQPAGAPS